MARSSTASRAGPEVAGRSADVAIEAVKRRYSCFLGTDMDLLLRGLGVQTLLVTGLDSNVCVLWPTGDGFQRDYHVRGLEDCTAGHQPEQAPARLIISEGTTAVGSSTRSAPEPPARGPPAFPRLMPTWSATRS